MSTTGLDAFDRTIQKTNLWLEELGGELRWEDREDVYHALRSTLHVLRDRLPAGEAGDLAAQLPLLVQGVFFQGWHPAAEPTHIRTRREFLDRVADGMADRKPEADPGRIVDAVFGLLTRKVSAGEIEDVKRVLPEEIRDLWPGSSDPSR